MTEETPIETRCELPEDAVPVFSMDIVSYFDGDGKLRYSYQMLGEAAQAQIVGVLELVKFAFVFDAVEEEDEDDD